MVPSSVVRFGFACFAIAAAVVAAGRAQSPSADARASAVGATVELEVPIFSGGYGMGFYEETARQFEALQSRARINIYGDPRMHDKLRVRVIDGSSYPDITFTELPWLNLVRAGRVVDLTPWLDGPNWEGDARWRDTFLAGSLDMWTLEERTYGLPLAQSCWTIFYNKRMFREHGWTVPRTWDEFFILCDAIKAEGVAPLALTGVYLRYGDGIFRSAYYSLVGADGWRGYNDLEPGARTDPRFARAAGVFQRVAMEHLVPGWEGMTHTAAQLAFLQERSAMVISGSWFVNEMAGKFPDGFELGAMNFPVMADGAADPTAVQGSNEFFFVFQKGDAERERLAVDFLRYMTSRERALEFARRHDSPVAVRGIPSEVFSEYMQDTAAMFENARETYSVPNNMLVPSGLLQAMTDARFELVKGRITPEEFGARLESAAEAVRQRRFEGRHVVAARHPLKAGAMLAILGAMCVWTALAVRRRLQGARSRPRSHGGELEETVADGARPAETPAAWFGPLRGRMAAVFVWPSFLLFAAIVLLPGAAAFVWSLSDWDSLNPREWVGTFNFRWLLFESDVFWDAFLNNLFLMIVPALVVVPLALLFAALVHRGVMGARTFRACVLFPNILGGVAASLIWLAAYDPANGFINSAIVQAGTWTADLTGEWWLTRWMLGFENFAWLSQERLFWSLIPIYVWLMVGFNLVLYLAAMQGIDPQYYEAAELDGAGPWAQFFRVTLPMIREVIVISVVFIVIGGLNTFEMVWLLTGQEPLIGNHVLATWMVSTMFHDFEIGRATAIAVVMFVLVACGTAAALLGLRRESAEG